MLRVGLTGGIGSGKSTVALGFESRGIPVYYTDIEARNLLNEDEPLKNAIKEAFGEESYINGEYNRKYIASIVFADKKKLELLDSIVHPVLKINEDEWFNKQTAPFAMIEAAILFETNSHIGLDKVIGVTAPLEVRIARVMKRDNISREEVLKRINSQMNDADKMRRCDYIIINGDNPDEEPMSLTMQVRNIYRILLELSE